MTAPGVDWNALLKAAQLGDLAARDRLCTAIHVRLTAVAQCRLSGWPRDSIADVVQDTMLVLVERLNAIESNPHLYALKVLRNKIGDALRNPGRARTEEFREDCPRPCGGYDSAESADGRAEAGDLAEHIAEAVMKLTPFCRQYYLGVLANRTPSELWEAARRREPTLKRGTFYTRAYRCREALWQLVRVWISQ